MDTETQNLINSIIKLQNQRNNEHHIILEQENKQLLKIKQTKESIISEKKNLENEKEKLEEIIISNQNILDESFSKVMCDIDLNTEYNCIHNSIAKINKEINLELESKRKLEAEYQNKISEFERNNDLV